MSTGRIRLELARESFVYVHPNEIMFARSTDHYVQALIQVVDKKKWAIRHSTLKDLICLLSPGKFTRLNRFYLINNNHFSHFDLSGKMLILSDGFVVPVAHRISFYIIGAINV